MKKQKWDATRRATENGRPLAVESGSFSTVRSMKLSAITLIAALSLCAIAFGQAPKSPSVAQSFHVRGTVIDPLGAVIQGAEITFNGEQATRATTTNLSGKYEIVLPLGRYTKAERRGFRAYRRPLFLVHSPVDLTFDIGLPVRKIVDRVVVGKLQEPLNYYGEEFLPASSKDGIPFQLYVRYTKRASIDDSLDYTGEESPYEDPVFVAYNLFSLQADHVIFNVKRKTLEASGNVVVSDETGSVQRAKSISLNIEDGHATPLR